jgi:hypothetical protein
MVPGPVETAPQLAFGSKLEEFRVRQPVPLGEVHLRRRAPRDPGAQRRGGPTGPNPRAGAIGATEAGPDTPAWNGGRFGLCREGVTR